MPQPARIAARAGHKVLVVGNPDGLSAGQAPGIAWFNAIIPTTLDLPLHPDQAEKQTMANMGLADL